MKRTFRFLTILAAGLPAAAAAQQGRALSIDDALRLAEAQSEAVRIAQAGVLRARGQQLQARSQQLPQVGASFTYTRTLASQFSALADAGPPTPPVGTPPVPPDDGTSYYAPCTRYLAGAGATEAQRLAGLETVARCTASTGGLGIDFSKVGFGSKNQYQLGLQGSLDLFSGGRNQAQVRAARASLTSAEIELTSQRARLALDITEAYFDAVLADRLVAIAESSLAQTESVLGQTRLARQVGNQSEFDLLRAQVTRDNQMPALLQRRTDRDLAYVRLRQMLNVTPTEPLSLTTGLGNEAALVAVSRAGVAAPTAGSDDTSSVARAPVRQLGEALRASQEQLRVARSAWIPTVAVSTQYGRVAFPTAVLPDLGNFLTNWTVSLTASVPLFTGGRTKGATLVAEAGVREAEARFEQVREAASLDAQQALALLNQAQAALAASQGTSDQAARAYSIAEVRYREGLSTQVELNDSRLLLQQASANAALAVRNLQVARMRVALLRDLPLGIGIVNIPVSTGGSGGGVNVQPATPLGGVSGASAGQSRAAASVVPPQS
ncbi:MAG: TolC family protein [Gemmataceae bacterium]|nr:TolC family protein [Gemmataceae bacterium]